MALPKAYLIGTNKLGGFLNSIRNAQSPERFTQKFLEDLSFKSSNDRLLIGVIKALGFLDDLGKPTARYCEFLDQTKSAVVLAEAIEEAYRDLFMINRNAYKMSKIDVLNKFKTLTEGKLSENILDNMARTFVALVGHADFSNSNGKVAPPAEVKPQENMIHPIGNYEGKQPANLGGLVYNIQIVLPETRDVAVYDALFRSLKEYLL